MKALIVSADQFEDTELLVPYYRLKEAGVEVDVASIARGSIRGKHGYEVGVDHALREVDANDYDLLVLPGGKAPAALRGNAAAIAVAQAFMRDAKPVAAICHGPQVLISAGTMQGRHATCSPAVADELRQAGGVYADREVVVDGKLVTSRRPGDLPAFLREIIRLLKR